jgi:hypothetical protein
MIIDTNEIPLYNYLEFEINGRFDNDGFASKF